MRAPLRAPRSIPQHRKHRASNSRSPLPLCFAGFHDCLYYTFSQSKAFGISDYFNSHVVDFLRYV